MFNCNRLVSFTVILKGLHSLIFLNILSKYDALSKPSSAATSDILRLEVSRIWVAFLMRRVLTYSVIVNPVYSLKYAAHIIFAHKELV